MKKKLMVVAMLAVLALLLAACGCKHEWKEATCTEAKTCALCGEVEGEALGHDWKEATCTEAKVCLSCELTEGEALGHDWQEATTEAPKTCANCKLTEGERIVTDSRFTTKATKQLQGLWTCEVNMTAEMMGLPMGFENGVACVLSMEFGNAGELVSKLTMKDEEVFKKDYRAFVLEYTYATLALQGVSKEDADAAMLQVYGLNVEDYVDATLKNQDISSIFSAFNSNEVYYVEGSKIYTALSWNSKLFEDSTYTLNNGVLTIDAMTLEADGEPLQWKKAE